MVWYYIFAFLWSKITSIETHMTMWNPLYEPTSIKELEAIHVKLRERHTVPSLELYAEYWNMLMGQSLHYAIERNSIGGKAFASRMRDSRIHSLPMQGLEQKIKKELSSLHSIYKETIVPYEKVDELLRDVEQFVKHKPTYKRLIPTALGYPKYKKVYGCCGLGLPSIPAIGFQGCLCVTYAELSKKVYQYMGEIRNEELFPHLQNIQGLLKLWKQHEITAKLAAEDSLL